MVWRCRQRMRIGACMRLTPCMLGTKRKLMCQAVSAFPHTTGLVAGAGMCTHASGTRAAAGASGVQAAFCNRRAHRTPIPTHFCLKLRCPSAPASLAMAPQAALSMQAPANGRALLGGRTLAACGRLSRSAVVCSRTNLGSSSSGRRQQRAAPSAGAAADAAAAVSPVVLQDNLFQDLCAYHGVSSSVRLQSSAGGAGLFAVEAVAAGDTIMRVPRSLCIVIDNEAGSMSIPQGPWPRLSGGLMQDEAELTCEWREAAGPAHALQPALRRETACAHECAAACTHAMSQAHSMHLRRPPPPHHTTQGTCCRGLR